MRFPSLTVKMDVTNVQNEWDEYDVLARAIYPQDR